MKIVVIINHFQPQVGYQEFFLSRAWQKQGHDVTVITSDFQFPFPQYDKTVKPIAGPRQQPMGRRSERGVDTIRLQSKLQVQGLVFWVEGLRKTLHELKPDIIFADGLYSLFTLQILLAAWDLKVPLLFDTHASSFNTDLYGSFIKRLFMIFLKIAVVPLVKLRANGYTAVGTSEKATLVKEYGLQDSQVEVVLLGAEVDSFKPISSVRKTVREELNYSEKNIVVVHAGKLTPEKDTSVLIDAFANISRSKPEAKLLIIGDGETNYVSSLKKQIEDLQVGNKITWLPPQPNEELHRYYNAADIGVWPGNLSNTIQEGMACSLPVILPKHISAHQGTDHLVAYENGLQFERGNATSLAKALEQLLTDKELRKTMGTASHRLIHEQLSWDQIAKRHLAVYNQRI